ncbi:MAG: hypothetical protein Q8L22_27285 [Reyranella sp.]|nr:hypothetical protein [Reyranella sp.]
MEVDYKKWARLVSWPGTGDAYSRGNPAKEGPLADMVKLGLEDIKNGCVGVRVLYDHGTLDAGKIKEVAARPDFPK